MRLYGWACRLVNTRFEGGEPAISLERADDVLLEGCEFVGSALGIEIGGGKQIQLVDSIFTDAGTGLRIDAEAEVTGEGCEFRAHGQQK